MPILIAFLLAAASLLGVSELAAQTVHPGVGVRIRAPGLLADRFEGVYLGRSGDTVLFGGQHYGPIRVPASAITTFELSRGKSHWEGAKTGALWGGGVYLTMGLALFSGDPEFANYVVPMVTSGASVGAIIGAIIGRRAWKRADPGLLLVRTSLDVHRRGVQLALRF